MIYREDYLIRQIKGLIETVSLGLKGRTKERLEEDQSIEFGRELWDALDRDDINSAEDYLFRSLDREDLKYLKLGLRFYDKINELTDRDLEEKNFSREEIMMGLKDLLDFYGLSYLKLDL